MPQSLRPTTTAIFILLSFLDPVAWATPAKRDSDVMRFPQLKINEGCYCSPTIAPVCGSRANVVYTYLNECILNCTKGVELLYSGPCCTSKPCSDYDEPVCDADNNMYPSPCAFEEAQCTAHHVFKKHLSMDSSAPACKCSRKCEAVYRPVCDSTGRTHSSLCAFANHQCYWRHAAGKDIEVAHGGPCCDGICHSNDRGIPSFLCDSSGASHSDLCSFHKARCSQHVHLLLDADHRNDSSALDSSSLSFRFPLSTLHIIHYGPCQSKAAPKAPRDNPASFFLRLLPYWLRKLRDPRR